MRCFMKKTITAEEKRSRKLDLSEVDVRARCVLRKLGVETTEKFLSLTKAELLALKNCGPKTTAKILELQARHGKDLTPQKAQETIDEAVQSSRTYVNRLIAVAIAANEVIAGAEKVRHNRYYFRVTTKRFNVLRRTLETLGKPHQR